MKKPFPLPRERPRPGTPPPRESSASPGSRGERAEAARTGPAEQAAEPVELGTTHPDLPGHVGNRALQYGQVGHDALLDTLAEKHLFLRALMFSAASMICVMSRSTSTASASPSKLRMMRWRSDGNAIARRSSTLTLYRPSTERPHLGAEHEGLRSARARPVPDEAPRHARETAPIGDGWRARCGRPGHARARRWGLPAPARGRTAPAAPSSRAGR